MVIRKRVLSERLKTSQGGHIPVSALVGRTKRWSFCKFPSLYRKEVDMHANRILPTTEVKVALERLLFVRICYHPY